MVYVGCDVGGGCEVCRDCGMGGECGVGDGCGVGEGCGEFCVGECFDGLFMWLPLEVGCLPRFPTLTVGTFWSRNALVLLY